MTRRVAILHTLGGPLVWLGLVPLHEKRAQPPNNVREAAIIRHALDLWEVRYYEEGVWRAAAFDALPDAQAFQGRYLLADVS